MVKWFEISYKILQLLVIVAISVSKLMFSSSVGNLTFDIRHWIGLLPLCSLGQVNIEKNQAADCIAKHVLEEFESSVVFNMPPIWLIDYLYQPFTI